MAAHATFKPKHPSPLRSASWPQSPTTKPATLPTISETDALELNEKASADAFQSDLEAHPERHFLSPMSAEEYRYQNWDSDSESDFDDDDDGAWNAGITDFSLFAADRKRAMETGEELDGRWTDFMEGQRETLERLGRDGEDAPALTPDVSPRMTDDLDEEGEMDARPVMPAIRVQTPEYLTVEVKPSSSKAPKIVSPDDELPLFLFPTGRKPAIQKVERPGLRHARTLSGRRHVWRRPGEDMFTVGEDVYGEAEAEQDELEEVARSVGALDLGRTRSRAHDDAWMSSE